MLDFAKAYDEAGLAVVPPKQDGSKRPYPGHWEEFQHEKPTPQQIKSWYRSGLTGIGTVTGAVSGNLELFEFDCYDTYLAFMELSHEAGLSDLVTRIREAYTEQTPNKGIHWYYRCEEIGGNTKLARRPEPTPDNPHNVKVLIETRGEGGYSVMAPSYGTVHPTGNPYTVICGSATNIITITPEERRALWELARTFDEMPAVEPREPAQRASDGDRPGDLYNEQTTWHDLLTGHGWKHVYRRGDTSYWRRPGKNMGISATTNHLGTDTLIVFSTSTPFETAPASYTKFAAYAVLEHGGDFQKASKQLWVEGYRTGATGELDMSRPLNTEHITVDEETGEIKPLLNGRQLLDMAIQSGVEPPHYLIPDLVVRGRIHLVYGEPESGKTILALSWVLEAIQQGIPVMFVDEESGLASVAQLLAAMGADSVDEYLHYFPFVSLDMGDTEALYAYAADLMPGLIVFDSLTDMLSSAGLDENKGIEVTQWFDQVAQRLARSDWQPAVVLIDHVSKDTANVKYAVASRAKKAKSDVQWFVEKLNDFDATKTAPLDLHRHKNRPGVLPKKVRFTIGGQDGRLICERFDPSQHVIETLPSGAQEMLELLEREVEMQTGEIANRLGKTRESIRLYGERLVAMGRAERVNAGPRSGYRATAKFGDATAKFGDAVLPNLLPNSAPFIGADLAVDGTGHKSIEDEEDEIW